MAKSYAAIEFGGADAETFLQAQLATDLRELTDGNWRWAAVCSLKGRVLGTGPLLRINRQRWLWLVDGDLAQSLKVHLSRYLLRSKLKIHLHLDVGLAATKSFNDVDVDQQLQRNDEIGEHCWVAHELPEGWNLTLSLIPTEATQRDQSIQTWEHARLAAGLAMVSTASSDKHLSHSLLLHQLHAVSLSKGCYPGQEIIARTHYLGRNKRSLALIEATDNMSDGDDIVSAGKTVGHIVEALPGGDALAAVSQEALDGGQLRVRDTDIKWRHTAIAQSP